MTAPRLHPGTLLRGRQAARRACLAGAAFTDVNPARHAQQRAAYADAGDRALAAARRRRLAQLHGATPCSDLFHREARRLARQESPP